MAGASEAAYGRLLVIVSFLNGAGAGDELPRELVDELAVGGEVAGEVGGGVAREVAREVGHEQAQAVREALRGLALANNGGRLYPLDLATLNQAIGQARLRPRLLPDRGVRLEPEAAGSLGALGRVLSLVVGAVADGSWRRLKACRNPSCRRAFYDQSRNLSRSWCSMAACGNRAKAARFRGRRRLDIG